MQFLSSAAKPLFTTRHATYGTTPAFRRRNTLYAPATSVPASRVQLQQGGCKPAAVRIAAQAGGNKGPPWGLKPLHEAVASGILTEVQNCLARGADPNEYDMYHSTPLHTACKPGFSLTGQTGIEIVRVLLEAGADVNAQDRDGSTPLHLAALRNAPNIATLLLGAGANPNMAENQGATPLHSFAKCLELAATVARARETLRFLGLDPKLLETRRGHALPPLKSMARKACDAVPPSILMLFGGALALLVAGFRARLDLEYCAVSRFQRGEGKMVLMIEELCKAGASLEARDGRGHTPLQVAAGLANAPAVKMLLAAGSDVQVAAGREQQTALHLAAMCLWEQLPEAAEGPGSLGRQEWAVELTADTVTTLVEAGVDVNSLNQAGETPLIVAARCGKAPAAAALLKAGASRGIVSRASGRTAEGEARAAGSPAHWQVVELLQ